jgi:O-antigen ligase
MGYTSGGPVISLTKIRAPVILVIFVLGALATVASALHPAFTLLSALALLVAVATFISPITGFLLMIAAFLGESLPFYSQNESVGTISIATAIGTVVLVSFIVHSTARSADKPLSALRGSGGRAALAVALYVAWFTVTSLWSPASIQYLGIQTRNLVEGLLIFVLGVLLLRQKHFLLWSAAIYALMGLVIAVFMIVSYRNHYGFNDSVAPWMQNQAYRGGLGSSRANDAAITVALVPGFTFLAASQLSRRLQLLLTSATVPIVGFVLLILASRGALVALAAAFIAILLWSQDLRQRRGLIFILLLGALTYGGLAVTGTAPQYFGHRFTVEIKSDNIGQRLPLWQASIAEFTLHPVTGVGAVGTEVILASERDFRSYGSGMISIHNDYIAALADTGLVGFTLMLIMLAIVGRTSLNDKRRNPAIIGIFVFQLVAMGSGQILDSHKTWVTFTILCCYGLTSARMHTEKAEDRLHRERLNRLQRQKASAVPVQRAVG